MFPSRHRALSCPAHPNDEHGVSYPKSVHLSLLQHSSRALTSQGHTSSLSLLLHFNYTGLLCVHQTPKLIPTSGPLHTHCSLYQVQPSSRYMHGLSLPLSGLSLSSWLNNILELKCLSVASSKILPLITYLKEIPLPSLSPLTLLYSPNNTYKYIVYDIISLIVKWTFLLPLQCRLLFFFFF